MRNNSPQRPVVVGGGAAGLAACLTLEAHGHAPLLIEASSALGGRLRTEALPDGTPVDVGFQVLQTAYPELQRWVDLEALDVVPFIPGAKVHSGGRWRTLADPRRAPRLLPATLTSGIGQWSDRWRMLRLITALKGHETEALQQGWFGLCGPAGAPDGKGQQEKGRWASVATSVFLREWGFSPGFMASFLGPFLSGIFLERELTTPAAQFHYTFRMLADGGAVRPRQGMVALVDHLRSKLRRTEVRHGARVQRNEQGALLLNGEPLPEKGVILTVPLPGDGRGQVQWKGCLNAVFSTPSSPFGSAILGLIPAAEWVTNFHFMEDLEGPVGTGRINVTAVLPSPDSDPEHGLKGMTQDLASAGIECNEAEWCQWIPHALPVVDEVGAVGNMESARDGSIPAGDWTSAPSLDAALRSGRLAAEAWLRTQAHPQTASGDEAA